MVTVLLEAKGISKRYAKAVALSNASLSVGAGEAVGLVGPNGSGKTTFLRCCAGLLKMDSGSCSIAGHDVEADHAAAMAILAFVPELPNPFPSLSPREHLVLTARAFRLAPAWEAQATRVLQSLDLSDRADRLCGELSKGQRQKVHIAEAMLRSPPIVLLDEPLIGVDPKGVRLLKDWIRARVAAGGAFLISSHTLPFVEELCNRVSIIENGRVIAQGSLPELRAQARAGIGGSLEDVFLRLTEAKDVGGPPV